MTRSAASTLQYFLQCRYGQDRVGVTQDAIAAALNGSPAWLSAGVASPVAPEPEAMAVPFEESSVVVSLDLGKDTCQIPKQLPCPIALLHSDLDTRRAEAFGT